MKIAILSRIDSLFSCNRLSDAAKTRGHTVDVIDPFSCYISINNMTPSIYYRGKNIIHYDAIIPRIGPLTALCGIALLRQFEILGTYPLNSSSSIVDARDKLHSLQILMQHGIDCPVTGFSHSIDDTSDLINMVGGAPLIVKLIEGTQGIGVILAETQQSAVSIIDALRSLKVQFLVQKFFPEANGCDIRCLVIEDKVIAAIERKAKSEDFRSNLHRGGSAKSITINQKEKIIAIRAAKALKLNVAGVDILRSNHGPLVMEVNASPGLEGIETTKGIDIATLIIVFIEKSLSL